MREPAADSPEFKAQSQKEDIIGYLNYQNSR